jgi:hypothetical protein
MLTFGKFAVDTGRFDTDVPRTAFDVLADMGTDLKLKPGQYLFGRPNIWPLISRMYEGYIEEPSQQAFQPGSRRHEFRDAWRHRACDLLHERVAGRHRDGIAESPRKGLARVSPRPIARGRVNHQLLERVDRSTSDAAGGS